MPVGPSAGVPAAARFDTASEITAYNAIKASTSDEAASDFMAGLIPDDADVLAEYIGERDGDYGVDSSEAGDNSATLSSVDAYVCRFRGRV